MKKISYEEMVVHKGGTICGPIPADIDPDKWVLEHGSMLGDKPNGEAYCIKLYDTVQEFGEGTAQFPRIQGTYWIKYNSESTYQIDIHRTT